MMPKGYWSAAITAVSLTTVINSLLLIGLYWYRVPLNGQSFFIPVEAPFTLIVFGILAILIGSLAGYVMGIFAKAWAIWVAGIIFVLIYMAITIDNTNSYNDTFDGVSGFAYLPGLVALSMWWLCVIRPLSRHSK